MAKPGLPTLNVPEPPQELVRALASNECALYAGAGLSARAGLPIWKTFVQGLLDWSAQRLTLPDSLTRSLRESLPTDPKLVADTLISRFRTPDEQVQAPNMPARRPPEPDVLEAVEYVRGMFVTPHPRPTALHQKLKALPFCAALTTNYDELLEQTYEGLGSTYTHLDSDDLLVALRRTDFFLVKLYGALSRPNTVLIAPMQYERALESNRLFARFMESLFLSRTLFFLGASLDGIHDYLSSLKLTGQSSRAHFALVDVHDATWEAKADALRRRFGIQVLPFTPSEGYPEVDRFVDALERAVATKKAMTPTPRPPKERGPLIKKIQVINIGPFDNFSLELDPHWNVLLGDNGVGKSSILRAVAIALAGLEARPYAARLVRSGQTRGTVALETERGRYVVELFRGEGEAEMKVSGPSPLSTEGWLAVGFPALRALTWTRSEERERFGLERPTATDLLPLVRGDPDPRFDKLKAWILELDHLTQRARADKTPDDRYRRQIEMLFEVITALTPGLRLEYEGVDPVTREVRVRTDDGVVPIECISQGTSSLFGWIGVLLQRMFDVHPESPTPWLEPSLVLIDEVDAHMHPGWQQLLGPRIRELFPRLQLIATSHSPLIVSSLRREEVLVLHRVKHQLVAERPSVDMKGYRADQILTSHLFGLDSTLPPETQDHLRNYTALAAKDSLTDAEERTFAALGKSLAVRLPSPLEREEARRAYALIKDGLDAKLKEVPLEEKQRVVDEVKAQLQEAVTGSYRPS